MNRNFKILGTLLLAVSAIGTASITKAQTKVSAADETVIVPFAHYEFNDATNIGKDSSPNGFDLVKKNTSANPEEAFKILTDETDGKQYIQIRRDQYATGVSKGAGACLYAPGFNGGSKDMSDLVSGSYTMSFTFRSDNNFPYGDCYALNLGHYGSCLNIVPWANTIEIQLNNKEFLTDIDESEMQTYLEAHRSYYARSTVDWTNVTIAADADNKKMYVYINGELAEEVNVPGVKLTSSNMDIYTFAIGAQINAYGGDACQFANVDVKDCALYDCYLTEQNVKALYQGHDATLESQGEDAVSVTAVEEIDLSQLDLQITDVNTLDNILNEVLPEKVKTTLSNGVTRSLPVEWFPTNGKIRGYVQSGAINPSQLGLESEYGYTAKFACDNDAVVISNIQLDGKDYVPGTPITSSKHLLTFKLEADKYTKISSVSYFDMEWDVDDDGLYYIDIAEGALIQIEATSSKFTVTYMDGEEKIGTSKYTYNGREELKAYEKEGFTFAGWYTDPELTNKCQGLDYANPEDITLYAKYVRSGSKEDDSSNAGEEPSTKKGCKGVAIPSTLALLTLAGALIISKKRK